MLPDKKCEKVTECAKMQVICAVLTEYHIFIKRQEERGVIEK